MVSEIVELKGHIIDSLSLPRVLDAILSHRGDFEFEDVSIGRTRTEQSRVRIRVRAPDAETLEEVLVYIEREGANRLDQGDAALAPAPAYGVLPDRFYATTNLPTRVRVEGSWIQVEQIEMDCGIVIREGRAVTTPMNRARKGDMIVVGHEGVRVEARPRAREAGVFEFMTSAVSSEKPKAAMVAAVARMIGETRRAGRKVLLVAGPAIVHAGSTEAVARMIKSGCIDVLFAGNALPLHDIEAAIYGTSLGISVEEGKPAAEGHEHHLRAVNTMRAVGSIAEAVRQGIVTRGIMYECVQAGVPYVLAGSIRDDGPLPDVITDTLAAQDAMREHIPGLGLALMVATTLHSVATGNLLPAEVEVVAVDINPAVVTKLADRGTSQAIGVVTDAALFMLELVRALEEECLCSAT
jgi:lysine-ketoglutarate reductase/saccharopine dehydrogenase-like protein (TIGR00300 family)